MPRNILIDPQRTGTANPNIQFSGSMANTIKLEVLTSGSVQFTGVSGSLLNITDSLSGSLFAVSDVSGLPILEAFSDDRVVMGRFNANTLVVTGSTVGIGSSSPTSLLDVNDSTNYSRLQVGSSYTTNTHYADYHVFKSNTLVGSTVAQIVAGTGITPGTTNTYTLGTTSSKWSNVVSTALSGSLTMLSDGTTPYLQAGTSISLSTGSSGAVTIALIPTAGSVVGTGTTNYYAKFTGTSTIGNGVVYDDGTNVGIGTASPGYKITIENSDSTVYTPTTQATPMASLRNTYGSAGNTQVILAHSTANYSSVWNTGLVETGGGAYTGAYVWQARTGVATWAERMRINSAGNVGIGTTGPGAKLHVSGSSTSAETTSIIKAGVASQLGAVLDVQSNLGTSVLVVSGSGRVGINTASPSINTALDVVGSIRVSANFKRPDDAGVALTVGDGIETHYQDTVTFNSATGVTEFARLTSVGLSVGTKAAATARLDISGSSSDTATTLAIKSGNTAAATAPIFDVKGTTGATLFFISGSGNVGIGTAVSNGNKLSVNGTTALTGSALPGATSTYDLGSSGMKWRTVYAANLTGSLTQLADGTSYLIAGTNVSISTGSNGAVTIAASLSGGAVTGTGTTSYVPRWTNSSTIAAGTMWDDGTNIGIGTNATNGNMLSVNGTTALTGSVLPGNTTSDLGSAAKPWRSIYATSHTTEASTTSTQYSKVYAPGEAGKLTATKSIAAAGTATVSLTVNNGAVLFDIMIVASESGFSVAKKYTVTTQYDANPVVFKIVDTGPYGSADFTVAFSKSDSTTTLCTITNGDASTHNFAITLDVAATSVAASPGTTVTIF